MEEILELTEAWKIITDDYRKRREGWGAFIEKTDSGFLSLLIRNNYEKVWQIVQDKLVPGMFIDFSKLPRPWRPVGMAALLDEDPTKVPSTHHPYGLRQVPFEIFERLMKMYMMIETDASKEEIRKSYLEIIRDQIKLPVSSYEDITTPLVSIGGFAPVQKLVISERQRELKRRLEAETRRLYHMQHPYIS